VRAVVTRDRGVMEVADVPPPDAPGRGEVIVAPEAVGLCGSDFHILSGELGHAFPLIQGHEIAATITAVGPDCPDHLQPGERVAVWPLSSCGTCYPCRIGRVNACARFSLIGVHTDGGLQERFGVPARQVFPIGDLDPVLAAFVEPMSIAVWAVERGRVAADEQVVVLGAGPIGQAVALAVRERGATAMLVDRVPNRLERGRATGAETLSLDDGDAVAGAVEWARGEGPEVVIDATGEPAALRSAVDMVVAAGRVVVVGISDKEVALPMGAFIHKEIDVVGSSVCGAAEFAEAVEIVRRNREAVRHLITQEFPLERTPEAIRFAMGNPADVIKVVIRP
jgi:L-gulonate 5-dehydrogenase